MSSKTSSKEVPDSMVKLPPLPQGTKIQKRPLTRRQPPASPNSRIIYVSSSTPFMAAVKRARKQLDKGLHGRAAGGGKTAAPKNATLSSRIKKLERDMAAAQNNSGGGENAADDPDPTTVTLMGTGRAVEKTLSLASWFEQQGDCHVAVRTRTVGTVDDVVVEDEDEEDDSRVRLLSCLEVSIRLK